MRNFSVQLARWPMLLIGFTLAMSGAVAAQQPPPPPPPPPAAQQPPPPPPSAGSPQTPAPPAKALPTSRREAAIMDWQQAKAWTKAYLEAMPAEHYGFKPVPEIRTFADQFLHAAQSTFALAAVATDRPNPYEGREFSEEKELQQKDAVIKRVMEAYDFVIEGLKATTDEKLNVVVPARRATVLAPKWQLLQWAFTNQTHHRGQTTIYLRLKGIVPPPQPPL